MPKKLSKFSFYSYNSRSTFRIQVQAKIELNKQMRNVSEITTKGAAGKNNNGSAMREKCERTEEEEEVRGSQAENEAGKPGRE